MAAFAGTGDSGLIAAGLFCFLAVTIPFLARRRFDPFEPMTLVAFSVLMGATLRAVMLAIDDPSNYKVMVLTDGISNGQLAASAALVPASLLALSIGYLSSNKKRFPIERLPGISNREWSASRLNVVIALLATVGAAAIFQLVHKTGVDFSNLGALSVKRAMQLTDDAEGGYARLGYLNWGSELATLALLLTLAKLFTTSTNRQLRLRSKIGHGLLLIPLIWLSWFWPLVSSSRTGVLQVVFGMAIIISYLALKGKERTRRRRFSWLVLAGIVFALVVLVAGGAWRQYGQTDEIQDDSVGAAVLNNTVGSGNFFPMERTAVIIDRVPERGGWLLGNSYANTIFAPIPRSLWHGKPEIGLGLHVKRVIYERPTFTNGYPPGLVGEAYINFGFVGSIVIPFFAGIFLGIFYNSFRPLLAEGNKNAVVLYAVALWPIGFQIMDLDFSLMFTNTMTAVIPILLILPFISKRARRPNNTMPMASGGAYTVGNIGTESRP